MRLKRGKSTYALPYGITPSWLILHVGKIRYRMQQIGSSRDFSKAVKNKHDEPHPTVWCFENPWSVDPAVISIYPPPKKAWKLEILAQKDVVL